MPRNQVPPFRTIAGTCASVSTLFTVVGMPLMPDSPGYGGLLRGFAGRPSMDSIAAVSSPAT
jgi:hypothetical protein